MSSGKLRSLADFEWASAVRYIVYVSCVAGLREINSYCVNSLPLARVGPEKLLNQKKRVLSLLEGNKARVERFVGEHKEELGVNELSVLRTMYLQYRADVETVNDHVKFIERCIEEVQTPLLQSEGEGQDDLF